MDAPDPDTPRMTNSRGPEFRAVVITFLVLASTAMCLRCYTRACLIKSWGQDDSWMALAMVFYIVYIALTIVTIHYGMGQHFYNLTPEQMLETSKFLWQAFILYYLCLIAAKVSVGMTLLRLTATTPLTWVRRVVKVVIGAAAVSNLVYMFIGIFQCHPVSKFWNPQLPGSCMTINTVLPISYTYSACNAVCDLIYGILPIFIVRELQVKLRIKIMLVPIIGMAAIASIAVFVRMSYFHEYQSADPYYDMVNLGIWSAIEPGLAIIAGSVATLNPLRRELFNKLDLQSLRSKISGGSSAKSSSKWHSTLGSMRTSRRTADDSLPTHVSPASATDPALRSGIWRHQQVSIINDNSEESLRSDPVVDLEKGRDSESR